MPLILSLRSLPVRTRLLLGIRAISPRSRYKSDARSAVDLGTVTEQPEGHLKLTRDIPSYSPLWTIYWYFFKGFNEKVHELQIVQKKKFGSIWKSRFGSLSIINVASAEMIEEILRQEGKYPIRAYMPHWREYRELRGHAYGPSATMDLYPKMPPYINAPKGPAIHNVYLDLMNPVSFCEKNPELTPQSSPEYGQKWHHMRSMLNPKMLKPKEVSSYSPAINEVVTDFVEKIRWLRETHGGGLMVYDISNELYKFSFEAICTILFETRMGCLEETIPEETQKFIASVFEMFHSSAFIIFFPKAMWPYLSYWRRFMAAWDYIFYITEKLVNRKLKEIQANMEKGKDVHGEYLTYLLTNTKMTPMDIYGSLSELLLAAVDTTSNTISWILYNLAKEPSIQQQLYEEVNKVCPGDQIPGADDFGRMPLLKAVVKETLRLYPVVPGNARLIVENDVVVGGYHFPKNTLFHMCHYAVSLGEGDFIEPQRFWPDRWLRGKDAAKKFHPFASIPFGFGTRTCLGKRVAELEMYSLVARLIKHFEVRPDPTGKVVTAKTRTLLYPSSPINLQLIDRM